MNVCEPGVKMADFAHVKMAELLTVMAGALHDAALDPHADAVHDMRVSIRRFQQGLRVFGQYLPNKPVRRVRKQIKRIMDCAGDLRNHDIAIGLVKRAGRDIPELAQQRVAAQEALSAVLVEVVTPGLADEWSAALRVGKS
jgi:CHAD domain-containing protein